MVFFSAVYLKENKPVAFQNALEEAVENGNWINARHLSVHLLNFLWDEMGSLHKALQRETGVEWLSPQKEPVQLSDKENQLLLPRSRSCT